MSVSESEFYEVGMSLPPEVRRHVALRLLESVDPDDAFDHAAEAWLRTEAVTAYERLRQDPSRAVPAEDVRARLNAKWAWPSPVPAVIAPAIALAGCQARSRWLGSNR